ncbi:hypothetical protein [Klebsiella aerogenes]|uniref:hypothetical protein n=1 Tax=Klebsiella aerogenes TaxID=548 RepID=UPI001BCDA310|nr:hypothetical protein [Klebsiella aerogenes]
MTTMTGDSGMHKKMTFILLTLCLVYSGMTQAGSSSARIQFKGSITEPTCRHQRIDGVDIHYHCSHPTLKAEANHKGHISRFPEKMGSATHEAMNNDPLTVNHTITYK